MERGNYVPNISLMRQPLINGLGIQSREGGGRNKNGNIRWSGGKRLSRGEAPLPPPQTQQGVLHRHRLTKHFPNEPGTLSNVLVNNSTGYNLEEVSV